MLFLSLNLLYELWLHVWAKGQDYILVSIQKSRLFVTLLCQYLDKGKVQKKKIEEKKLTSVSFMYVCVAESGEMLVFFLVFFPTIV